MSGTPHSFGHRHLCRLRILNHGSMAPKVHAGPPPASAFPRPGGQMAGTEQSSNGQLGNVAGGATVIRGVLVLRDCPRTGTVPKSVLLDISGRKVLGLHPGANDVSRLSPGVYFVREAQTQAVRKVIIAR